MVVIREMKKEEIPEVISLYNICGLYVERISNEKVISQWRAKNPQLFLAAEEDKQIVGSVYGQPGIVGSVWKLCVLPSYRNKGIGTGLMKEILARLKKDGSTSVNLFMDSENPHYKDVLRYYQKRGWRDFKIMTLTFPLSELDKFY